MNTKHNADESVTYTRCINEMMLNDGIAKMLSENQVLDAYAQSLRILESDLDDGISVKAKDGNLFVTVPKRA